MLTNGYTGETFLRYSENDFAYVDATDDVSVNRRDGCHPKFGGRDKMSGYECVWSLGDLFIPQVECSAANSSFCQACVAPRARRRPVT